MQLLITAFMTHSTLLHCRLSHDLLSNPTERVPGCSSLMLCSTHLLLYAYMCFLILCISQLTASNGNGQLQMPNLLVLLLVFFPPFFHKCLRLQFTNAYSQLRVFLPQHSPPEK